MKRDWDAEQARLESDYQAARVVLDAAFGPAHPAPNVPNRIVLADALQTFHEAHVRFEAAKERFEAFLVERKRDDLTLSPKV